MGRVLAVGLFGALACAQVIGAQTASVTGTITTAAKGTIPIRLTIDQKVCGNELPDEAIVVDGQGHLANAVVVLTGLKRPSTVNAVVMNEKCRFAPRVQVVRPNSNVRATSKDPVLHTTQAQQPDGRTIFNVALPVPGINVAKPIGAAGIVRLNCNTHPWMRGWIIVTDEAAAISGGDGRFTIVDVPPGTYEARVWHESLKGASQKITVVAGKPTEINFLMK
jgi:hypothetical protein